MTSWQTNIELALTQGRTKEAEEFSRLAVSQFPDNAVAHFLLGLCLQHRGDHFTAAAAFRAACQVDAALLPARQNLATSLRALGAFDDAEVEFRAILREAPSFVLAYAGLGNLLRQRAQLKDDADRARRFAEARVLHESAVNLEPDVAGHAHNLFITLTSMEAWDEAAFTFLHLAVTHTKHGHFYDLAARALVRIGRFSEAADAASQALRLLPTCVDARVSLASAMRELGSSAEAERQLEIANAEAPDHAVAAFNLAQIRCFRGRWREGLAGLHADRVRQWSAMPSSQWPAPSLWQGQAAPSSHLILLAEQGLGDTIQFLRFAAAARSRVGRVTLAPPRSLPAGRPWLSRLALTAAGIDDVLAPGSPMPAAELFAPLFSLPHLCGPEPNHIVAPPRYLQADPQRVQHWSRVLGPRAGRTRVAIAWQGNPQYRADTRRSMPLATFEPLFAATRQGAPFELYSLQKGFGSEQLSQWHAASQQDPVVNLADQLDNGADTFADTAAVLELVDLLISSDTSLPHLSAALGRPTWMLLPAVPDWRWEATVPRSPWYPTMRLFRQRQSGQWAHPMSLALAQLPSFMSRT
jgi:tetratricopeptide (TPR) repeat protein